MRDQKEKLTVKMELAAMALVREPTLEAAARSVGVAESTLYRWLKMRVFLCAYRQARRLVIAQAQAAAQSASRTAVQVLDEIMRDSEVTAASRIAAARTLLDVAAKAAEFDDLDERLQVLEQSMGGET